MLQNCASYDGEGCMLPPQGNLSLSHLALGPSHPDVLLSQDKPESEVSFYLPFTT